MQQKKVIPVKYFYWGMAITFLLIVGVIGFLFQKEATLKKVLQEKGIKSVGWVLDLKEHRTKKKRGTSSANYYMNIAFFVDTTTIKPLTTDTATSKTKNGVELVDKVFNKIHAQEIPMGNYQTFTIPISMMQFKKYTIDDKVNIIYLKEDPTQIMLLENVY